MRPLLQWRLLLGFATKLFPYLGLPKILQSDNGREFVSRNTDIMARSSCDNKPSILDLKAWWKRVNHCVEVQIRAMKLEWRGTGNAPCTDWLPRIQYL